MSIFDGLTAQIVNAFGNGASATFTAPGGGSTVVAGVIFREHDAVDDQQIVADGRSFVVNAITLQIPRNAAVAPKNGWTVTVSVAPGRTFKVLQPMIGRNPAADGLNMLILEDIT